MAETTISMRGLKCPLPALKTRKLLSRMASGDVLLIECTDPLTPIDIPNLLRETGDKKYFERMVVSDHALTERSRDEFSAIAQLRGDA